VRKEDEARFTLRLPRDLLKRVKHKAVEEDMSTNSVIAVLLEQALESPHEPTPIAQHK
jgi:predicted DNA binding CopG/RHH family protein